MNDLMSIMFDKIYQKDYFKDLNNKNECKEVFSQIFDMSLKLDDVSKKLSDRLCGELDIISKNLNDGSSLESNDTKKE